MTSNVGTLDRIARIIVGAALIAFALGYLAPGTGWNWVGWIGVVPILPRFSAPAPPTGCSGCRPDKNLRCGNPEPEMRRSAVFGQRRLQ